jgi:citrate lyase subunit beta/citryl-CoA lyase
VIPKCENREQLLVVENEIELVRKQERVKNPVFIMPIIESALGVENSFEIAGASRSIAAIAIGLEDLTADLGVSRTAGGEETLYARTRVVNAARAAGIQPVDSVFPDMEDMDALRSNVLKSKAIGFAGMGCIHPLQVPVVNEGFAPGEEEIARSREIVVAFEQAERESRAVTVVRSRMIDAPVVKRARQTIATAIKFGRLNPSWRNETRVS